MRSKIELDELRTVDGSFEVIAHSVEGAIYTLRVKLDGRELLLVDQNGKTLSAGSVGVIYQQLEGVALSRVVLSHSSAYDEMIGQPARETNTLEVTVADPISTADRAGET